MTPEPFPTLAELRVGHRELLQDRRNESDVAAFNERVRLFLQRGQISGLFLELENERWEAQNLLDYWSNELYHLVQEDINATLAEFDPTLAPELDDSLCPYIGLDPFDTDDQKLFFGREPMIKTMIERLQQQSFLAVSGPSGSGKTSLVLAGLLPLLKAGGLTGSDAWLYLPTITPGSDPIASLVQLLRTADNSVDWAAETSRQLLLAPETLFTLLERRAAGKTAVVVIDQFEELFTLCQDQPARQGFVDNLLYLIQAKTNKHILILTMRTDLENNLLRMADFQTAYAAAQLRVTAMSAPELRQAIQQPADLVGLKFEEGVIEQLVSDVLGEPAALPLLQFTLLKLWQKRDRNRVTWEAYKTLGSGRDALANIADRLYSNLNPAEQRVARRMLLKMVRPTQGLDVVRNRVFRQQLSDLAVGQPRVDYVVNHFVRERLLRVTAGETREKDQLEIAHEALVRNWPRLIGWLEDERASLRHRLRLTETAEQWDLLGRDESALLRGLVLDEAQQYTDLSELEKLFVEASITAVKREEIEREASRQRELEQTRQFARRLSILVVALAIIILISFGLALLARYNAVAAEESAVIAENARSTAVANESAAENARATAVANANLAAENASTAEAAQINAETNANLAATAESEANIQRDIAETERILAEENALAAENARATAVANENLAQTNARLATARELAAASLAQLTSDPQLSLLLALEAMNATLVAGERPPAEATDALYRAVRASQQLFTLAGHTGPIYDTAVSSDGRWIATASDDNSVKIWNAITGQQVHTLIGHNAPITGLAFSSTNQHLASVSNNSLLIVWDVEAGSLVRVMRGEDDGGARTVAFHPDGQRVAVGYEVGTARVWDFTTGNSLLRQFNHNQPINDVAFTPDGVFLITASQDGNILIQNATTGTPLNSYAAEFDAAGRVIGVNDVAVSLDGRRLAAAKSNGIVRVWEDEQLIATLSGHSGAVTAVAFSSDGLQLATAGADSSAKVWDIANERPILTLSGHTSDLTGIAFYPSDERLVTASIDNSARVWNATLGLEPLVLTDHRGPINGVQYNADGSQLATASSDNTVRIWDSETGEVLSRLIAFSNPVNMGVFHPTEPLLATASEDTVVRLFDLTTGQLIEPLYFHPEVVNDLTFNSDGTLLATAGRDGMVRLWDTAVHQPISLLSHDAPVNTVAFNADDSLLVATSNETAVVWDVATGEAVHHIAGHTGLIYHAVFSPDGQYVATAGADGLVKLWQLATGEAIRTFSGHGGPVLWVAFDAAGLQLGTAGVDRTARLWDVETGTLLRTVVGHTSAVTTVGFNPTGDNLVSASLDGTTRVTPFTTINELLAHAWGRLARPLTPAQCSQYLRGLPCITTDLNATPPALMP